MSAFQRFEEENKYLFNDTKSFTNVSWNEYLSYVQPLMKKIDELTPLD
jgi:CO dehydrogenase/acetyl-CoA synthase epsilon subunit